MNYDINEYIENSWQNRYPQWIEGIDVWNNFCENPIQGISGLKRSGSLLKPRVFVSYKSKDRQYAFRLAYLADDEGFNYWLDVLDPNLTAVQNQQPYIIASIIELALLNSSHIIAAMTPNTRDSAWVPYEFGRAKDATIMSSQAASWISPQLTQPIPEYLLLCIRNGTENEIRKWLTDERTQWENIHGVQLQKPAGQWPHAVPAILP
jgi:hypothetical protein